VDDEQPALTRLQRLLGATGRVDVAGTFSDPVDALDAIRTAPPDLLFLDIHMPGLSGFELLAGLTTQPLVIFTTAYDQHALEAFEVNSIDYLLKPIESQRLDQALLKAERMLRMGQSAVDVSAVLAKIASALPSSASRTWLSRVASRSGDRIEVVDLRRVTHFVAREKLTFAVTPDRDLVIDQTIADLEERLNPVRFVRIHRGVIVNLDHVADLHTDFAGRMSVRLKDGARTSLTVSRERVRTLKERLGI
jgi:two-component system LytT family response regulator